jgi:ABC-2 type transport system permease protein
VTAFSRGGVLWLLGHELRLSYRARSRASGIGWGLSVLGISLLMFIVGVPVAYSLRHVALGPTHLFILIMDVVEAVMFTLLMSQTLAQATMVFYERGDLDLLLSSPLPPWRVLAARATAIATMPYLVFCSMLTPFLLPLAFFHHANWLGAYLVLGSLAFAATALGLIVATLLFATIGPRRTKTVGQVLAAVIGAAFFLVAQLGNIFPDRRHGYYLLMMRAAHSPLIAQNSPLSWPARAVISDPWPLIGFVSVSLLFFAGTCRALGTSFALNAAAATGADTPSRKRQGRVTRSAFAGGIFRALMRKEFRLFYRDPALISQVLLRMLYVLPLIFIVIRNAAFHLASSVAAGSGALVFVASQISANLAWIAISGEDAPELIASAPVTLQRVRLAKLASALVPLVVLLAMPVGVLAWFAPGAAVISSVGIACAALSSALINIWYEKPGQRKHFRRRGSGSFVASLGEFFVGVIWSATTVAANSGTPWAAAGAMLALAVLYAFSFGATDPLARSS